MNQQVLFFGLAAVLFSDLAAGMIAIDHLGRATALVTIAIVFIGAAVLCWEERR